MRDPSRRGRQDLPSSRRKPLGHAFLFAEQGNRVRLPDTEGISFLRLQPMNHRMQRWRQNSESSCISKVLLPCREICVRWKSVIGMAVMAPREGWSNAFVRGEIFCTWIDKSEDLQTKEVKETCAKSAGHFSIQDTKAMVKTIIVFLLQNHSFHPLRAVPSSDIARGAEEIDR